MLLLNRSNVRLVATMLFYLGKNMCTNKKEEFFYDSRFLFYLKPSTGYSTLVLLLVIFHLHGKLAKSRPSTSLVIVPNEITLGLFQYYIMLVNCWKTHSRISQYIFDQT